jgi:hypothetical protein
MFDRHVASRKSTVQSVQTSERLRDAWMCVEVVVADASTGEGLGKILYQFCRYN